MYLLMPWLLQAAHNPVPRWRAAGLCAGRSGCVTGDAHNLQHTTESQGCVQLGGVLQGCVQVS